MSDEVSDEYVEAVLTAPVRNQRSSVEEWLQSHGLRAIEIEVGVLAQGTRQAFERAFGVRLHGTQLPVSLPVPRALNDVITSIVIPAPRYYHGSISPGFSR